MFPRPRTSGPDDAEVVPLRPASQHEVRVVAEVGQADDTHTFVTETLVTSADRSVELLAAAHDEVELDLIGSVQRDGAITVTVTVQGGEQPDGEAAADPQSWTTTVPEGASADFAVEIADGDPARAGAHGTIGNRVVP